VYVCVYVCDLCMRLLSINSQEADGKPVTSNFSSTVCEPSSLLSFQTLFPRQ
jgi:hypothetical protein